jgi:hypothetical protein
MTSMINFKSLLFIGLIFLSVNLFSTDAKKDDYLLSKLVGTWRITSFKINGQVSELPKTAVTLKHVTPEGFTWLSYIEATGIVYRAGGGTFTLAGNKYTERIDYGFGPDFESIYNTEATFTCKIEGDTWFHTGALANGTILEEVWIRVKNR